ncbi:MAG TPA: nucleotidyl transferase AbiEii/AbiGii toxin family protein [Candidatus Sabulitectum sp.]|nr:nucleotidyl transferase AbiEii/AbiGii toxin family protein [Candidatus Sabulitectum sp.]HRW77305.1 nucleotidyl transferase AbiEii/AbiGii toxin family protein [Candidatus Sabulitectum sp.]
MRALYQRKKGRDLFDLWYALSTSDVDVISIVGCFSRYMSEEQGRVTMAMFKKISLKSKVILTSSSMLFLFRALEFSGMLKKLLI